MLKTGGQEKLSRTHSRVCVRYTAYLRGSGNCGRNKGDVGVGGQVDDVDAVFTARLRSSCFQLRNDTSFNVHSAHVNAAPRFNGTQSVPAKQT